MKVIPCTSLKLYTVVEADREVLTPHAASASYSIDFLLSLCSGKLTGRQTCIGGLHQD